MKWFKDNLFILGVVALSIVVGEEHRTNMILLAIFLMVAAIHTDIKS